MITDINESRSGARHSRIHLHKSNTELTEVLAYPDNIDSNHFFDHVDLCVENSLKVLIDEGTAQ